MKMRPDQAACDPSDTQLAAKIQPRNSRKVMCTRICVPAIEPILRDQDMGNLGLAGLLSGQVVT
jgi:hypothetical protein